MNKIAATNDSILILHVLKDWPISKNELLKIYNLSEEVQRKQI